ncbi:hypothetical protein PTKIN_Ptkin07bG0109300 [Pterospermum kingtungense]
MDNILPVGVKLQEKTLFVDGVCQVCGSAAKSALHVLLECSYQQIWMLLIEQWKRHNVLELCGGSVEAEIAWQPPSRGKLKLNTDAELLAVYFGLQLALSNGIEIDVVETDSLLAIREIKKSEWSMLEWFGLIKDINMFGASCSVKRLSACEKKG